MTKKLPNAEKSQMIHFVLDYVAGNMAKPSEIKLDLHQEYSFLDHDFDQLIDELVEHELLDKRGEYLSLTLRGRFLLKESPDLVTLKAFEQMKAVDPAILVRPKITQKPVEMLRWYKRVLKYFPVNTYQMVATLFVLILLFWAKLYIYGKYQ
jgi:hypothetical protein